MVSRHPERPILVRAVLGRGSFFEACAQCRIKYIDMKSRVSAMVSEQSKTLPGQGSPGQGQFLRSLCSMQHPMYRYESMGVTDGLKASRETLSGQSRPGQGPFLRSLCSGQLQIWVVPTVSEQPQRPSLVRPGLGGVRFSTACAVGSTKCIDRNPWGSPTVSEQPQRTLLVRARLSGVWFSAACAQFSPKCMDKRIWVSLTVSEQPQGTSLIRTGLVRGRFLAI